MLIYICVFNIVYLAILFDFIKVPLKLKKIILIFEVLSLTLLYGLSWKCSGDWDQYYGAFKDAEWDNIFHLYRYELSDDVFEPGFALLNVICKSIWNSYSSLLLIGSFFRFGIMAYCAYRYTKMPLVFFATYFSMDNAFPTRQHFVYPVVVLSIFYFFEQKKCKSAIYAVVSFLIHKSSLFAFPFIYLSKVMKQLNLPITYILLVFAISFGVFAQDYIMQAVLLLNLQGGSSLADSINNYSTFQSEYFADDAGRSLSQILLVFIFVFMFSVKSRYVKEAYTAKYSFFYNMYVIYVFIQLFTSYGAGDVGRISNYLMVSYAWLMSAFFQDRFKFRLCFVLALLMLLEYRLYGYVTAPYAKGLYIPYKHI